MLPLPPPSFPSAVVSPHSSISVPAPLTFALPLSTSTYIQPPPLSPPSPPPPPPPSDPALLHAITRLAEFVHRNGQFEEVIKSRHPPHAPGLFAFLYDVTSAEYQYYRWKQLGVAGLRHRDSIRQTLSLTDPGRDAGERDDDDSQPGSKRRRSRSPGTERPLVQRQENAENGDGASLDSDVDGVPLQPSDGSHSSLAAMEHFIHRLSSTDTVNQRTHIPEAPAHNNTANSPNSNSDTYADYTLPSRFFSQHHTRLSQPSHTAIAALAASAQLDDSNVGFRLLAKMGWKGGEGLGKDGRKGRTEPVMAHVEGLGSTGGLGSKLAEGKVGKKKRKGRRQYRADGGVGSIVGGGMKEEEEEEEEERMEDLDEDEDGGEGGFADVYESYKRQMSMKYQHRPNPLNNPRRPY